MSLTTQQTSVPVAAPLVLQAVAPAASRVRVLTPQILLLTDFEFTPAILEKQREAFPEAAAPAWPAPQGAKTVETYAEACCHAWFFDRTRVIDPARPYFLVGFRSSCAVALELGRQLSVLGRSPAGVIEIGPVESGVSVSATLVDRFRQFFRSATRTWARSAPVMAGGELSRVQRHAIRASSSAADRALLDWSHKALARHRPSAEPRPFPVFQLLAERDGRPTRWLDNQRCQVRADADLVEQIRASEVNAFILRIVLAARVGIQLDANAAAESASATLDRVAAMIEQSATRGA